MILAIYLIGLIISGLWGIRYVKMFSVNGVNSRDIWFIVTSAIFSWFGVIVFTCRYYFGHDADMMRKGYKKEEKKYKTYHIKGED